MVIMFLHNGRRAINAGLFNTAIFGMGGGKEKVNARTRTLRLVRSSVKFLQTFGSRASAASCYKCRSIGVYGR